MVPARGVKDGLDTAAHAQTRIAFPSESSQVHHGRRGQTSITFRFSTAIPTITCLYSSESPFYDAILQREHYFYNRFHTELHRSMKYSKLNQILNIASLFPLAILSLHESDFGTNASFELILKPHHVFCPALEHQPKTHGHVYKSNHVDQLHPGGRRL